MILALLGFLLTITGDMDSMELSSIASRMARGNYISKGHCVRFDFERYPATKICRTDMGTPFYCRVYVMSSWIGYEIEACEEFNEI